MYVIAPRECILTKIQKLNFSITGKIRIKKKKNLGHLTSSTLVQDTHKSVKPTKLKLLLAKHKQVSGTHGEYSFADLKKARGAGRKS